MSHIYCRYEARDRGAGCLLRPTSISPLPPYFSPFLSLGNRVVRVRALAFHQCGAGSIPSLRHMWVEFVVGSRLTPRVSLWAGSPVFLPPQKSTIPNSNSTRKEDLHEKN